MLSVFMNLNVRTRLGLSYLLVIGITIVISLLSYQGFKKVQATWSDFESITLKKRVYIEEASNALGSGIHYFKNYVLREGDYESKFNHHMTIIVESVNKYKSIGKPSKEEIKQLDNILVGVDAYQDAMQAAVELKSKKKSIVEIDASIKGADKPVNQALKELLKINNQNTTQSSLALSNVVQHTINMIEVTSILQLFLVLVLPC